MNGNEIKMLDCREEGARLRRQRMVPKKNIKKIDFLAFFQEEKKRDLERTKADLEAKHAQLIHLQKTKV